MHNRLEEYLNEIAERLGPLPVIRRNDEVREMRRHLQDAILVNQEFGQSEEEAALTAVRQFGLPQELAQSLISTWQREERLTKRSLWGAAACTSVIMLLQYLAMLFVFYHTDFNHFLRSLGPDGYIIAIPWNISLWVLPGCISGTLFWKRAVLGTALAALFWHAVWHAINAVCILAEHQQGHNFTQFLVNTTMFSVNTIMGSAVIILASWAASRWQQARRGRTTLSAA